MSNELAPVEQYTVRSRQSTPEHMSIVWNPFKQNLDIGACLEGVILGLELNKNKKYNLHLKSLNKNGISFLIFGSGWLQGALFDRVTKNQLFFPGDVVRVIYHGSYKETVKGELVDVPKYQILELCGYQLTERDTYEVSSFVAQLAQKMPLEAYQATPIQPQNQFLQSGYQQMQQPYVTPTPNYQQQQSYVQVQPVNHYQQMQQPPQLNAMQQQMITPHQQFNQQPPAPKKSAFGIDNL